MDFYPAIINGLIATVAYVVIFFGVYKVFQIANDIREIKDLAMSSRRVSAAPAPSFAPEISKELIAEDSAAAYAEHLLRTVKPE